MRRNGSLAIALLAAAAFGQKAPTAEQILDRYIEVTGGKAAHEAVRTEVMKALTEIKAQGIAGPTESYRDGKNYYLVMEIKGAGKIEYGSYNGIVWENSAVMGPRLKTGAEKAFYEREAVLDKDLNWRQIYRAPEMGGEEDVAGNPAYKVILTPKDGGKPETRYYDKASGLLVRATIVTPSPMGEIPADQMFLEYRDFHGLKIPVRSVTKMGAAEMQVTVTSLDLNKPIPAEKFRPPPDVMALVAKQNAAPAKK